MAEQPFCLESGTEDMDFYTKVIETPKGIEAQVRGPLAMRGETIDVQLYTLGKCRQGVFTLTCSVVLSDPIGQRHVAGTGNVWQSLRKERFKKVSREKLSELLPNIIRLRVYNKT